ncbi:MAG: ABC transporter [Sphingobacteriales bacterium 50-39]|nr:ATP-binding cassette domain-containing protein [Sphingobacteriales bacterium]OJW55103.1 MAG: ABC transporter [Sphingobacteriales bacterium 50-39]
MADNFLSLEGLTVTIGGRQVLNNLYLNILRGQQWAITGASGSGKSVLAHTLMGRHFHSGQLTFFKPVNSAIVEQQHRFLNRSGTTDLYYQQRFNASDAEQTITVAQELTPYASAAGQDLLSWEGLDNLHIRPLLARPLIQLSNGENKRVQLAIALLENPDLLILDNPFLGLDTEGRATLHHIINMLAAKGIQLLLITSSRELPASITHVARLEEGKWTFQGPKEQFHPGATTVRDVRLDTDILQQLQQYASPATFSTAVKMTNVHVYYGEKTLLEHIDWEVKKGERWNVSGPNGAGKSTLLSLITADNPQAYANDIRLFDRRRGTGETIWEVKQKIGFVSPELHLYFDYGATCFQVIASGLFDTIGLFRPLTDEQTLQVSLWMKLLSLGDLRASRLAQLSTGQQRMVLLARALIKNPPMLILDEPCQGLDEERTSYFRQLIGLLCEAFGTTLIYVSHYKEEIPDVVDRFLRLDNGRIAAL